MPDAVDDALPDAPDPVVLEGVTEPVEPVAVADVEPAPPLPLTGLGVGLPAAKSKFAHARAVWSWLWMTILRLSKKLRVPGSVDR